MNWHTKSAEGSEPEAGSASWADVGSAARRCAANENDEPIDFDAVYDHQFEFVWRALRMLGVERASLDDAAQDVFGAVARQLGSFEGRSSLRTWVFGIAQNIASNHRRWRARKRDPLEPIGEGVVSGEPAPDARAETRETVDVVLRFCAELDESRRAVFVLGLVEGVAAAEIAASLGIPINTVYSRMHALRKELKTRIDQREVET